MTDLLEYIYQQISQIHNSTYLEQAPQSAQMPHVTFNCDTLSNIDYRDFHTLVVNVWDNITDTTALELIADNIINKLDRTKYVGAGFVATINKVSRLSIPDPDTSIRRRELKFEIKTREVK